MSSLIEKEGKHYIKGKVVMLESKDQTHQVKEGDLFINDTRKYSWGNLEALRCERVTQHGHAWNGTGIRTDICHLYITSDDKIKDADYFIVNNTMHKCIGLHKISGDIESDNGLCYDISKCKKVIATTDTSLFVLHDNGMLGQGITNLPSPSESFIKAYIEAYNNGNVIEDVLIEVNTKVCVQCGAFNPSHAYSCLYPPHPCRGKLTNTLKLKDNNIIIRKVKDSWTREEVHSLMMEAWIRGEVDRSMDFRVREKWIEENL